MSDKPIKGATSSAVSPSKRAASGDFDKDEPQKKKIIFSSKIQRKDKHLASSSIKPGAKNTLSISIKPKAVEQKQKKIIPKAAAAFDSSDSEPEEMPLEARMRMRNIGRQTPTSSGPNSFNKGRLGFVDSQKSWQKQQQSLLTKIKKPDGK